MYNRFDNGIHPRENIFETICAVKDHTTSMEEHHKLLEKVKNLLKYQIIKKTLISGTMSPLNKKLLFETM